MSNHTQRRTPKMLGTFCSRGACHFAKWASVVKDAKGRVIRSGSLGCEKPSAARCPAGER